MGKTTTRVFATNSAPIRPKSPKSEPRTDAEKAAQEGIVEKLMNNDRLAQIRAEQARLRDEMRTLRDGAKAKRLEDVIASQKASPNKALVQTLQAALRGRLLAGQPRDEAIAGVLENCRAFLEATPAPEPKAKKAAADASDASADN